MCTDGDDPSFCDFTFFAQHSTFAGRMAGQSPQSQQMSWEDSEGVKGAQFGILFGSLSFNTGLISSQY